MRNLGKIGIVGGIGLPYNPFEKLITSAKKAEEVALENSKKLEDIVHDDATLWNDDDEFKTCVNAIEMEVEILNRSDIPFIEPKCKNQVWAKKGKNSRF